MNSQDIATSLPNPLILALAQRGYKVSAYLGQGSAGQVYRAVQSSTGQTVALKVLRIDEHLGETQRARLSARFRRETGLCARLHHPHVVSLLDKGWISDLQWYAVFEFIPGETLAELLLREGALSVGVTRDLMLKILDALVCAHAEGIIHRDLKPQNIMISRTGAGLHPKVLDFGIGVMVSDRQMQEGPRLTMTHETLGTPSYSAPEQLRGEPPTVRCDLYAWGLIFLECLTGRQAIRGNTLAEIFHHQLSQAEVPLPAGLIDHPLAALLRRALHKDSRMRIDSASQLYEELNQLDVCALVGKFVTGEAAEDPSLKHKTLMSEISWRRPQYRQVTTLYCSLALLPLQSASLSLDIDTLDVLQRDQIRLSCDTGVRFGGYFAGAMGNCLKFHFGYPHAGDDDARRAARTALEMLGQAQRSSRNLALSHSCKLEISIGIHTGRVLTRPDEAPEGLAPVVAQRLERMALPGGILVSDATRRLLERHVMFEPTVLSVINENGVCSPVYTMTGEYVSEAASFLRQRWSVCGLVGRVSERRRLLAAWKQTCLEEGSAWWLTGEAGIGKSRLAHEQRLEALGSGGVVMDCHALPENQNNALYPFLNLLSEQLQLADGPERYQAFSRLELALRNCGQHAEGVLPILCSWMRVEAPGHVSPSLHAPHRQRKILLEAICALLYRRAEEVPLLLVFEDAHWADQTSLELLAMLANSCQKKKMCIVVTARPEAALPANMQILRLENLSREDSISMIQSLSGARGVETGLVCSLSERAGGVPLFIEELFRVMFGNNDGNSIACLSNEVPITLRDSLEKSLDSVGAAKETAQLAATIGREFDEALLLAAWQGDERDILADLDVLERAGLIYRQRRAMSNNFVFRHALLRDAAYDSMARHTRESFHGHVGLQMELRAGDDTPAFAAELTRHFGRSAQFDKAVKYGLQAAQCALDRGLYDDAISFLSCLKDYIHHVAERARAPYELSACMLLTQAQMLRYGWADPRVGASAERALILLEQHSGSDELVPNLWALAVYHHVASHRPRVRQLAEYMRDLGLREHSDDIGVAAQTMLGMSFWIDGQYAAAAEAFHRVIQLHQPGAYVNHARRFGLDTRVWSLASLASVSWYLTEDAEGCFAMARQAVTEAEQLQHIPSMGIAMLYEARLQQNAGNRTQALGLSRTLLSLAEKYGLQAVSAYAGIIECWAVSDLDRLDQILRQLRAMGCMLGLSYYSGLLAELEAERENFSAALRRNEQCIALCDEIGEFYYLPELYCRRAEYLERKHGAVACTEIRQTLERSRRLAQGSFMRRTVAQCDTQLRRWLDLESLSEGRQCVSTMM